MWRRYARLVATYTSLAQQTTESADAGGVAAVATTMLIDDLDQLRCAIDRHERDVHRRSTPWAVSFEAEGTGALASFVFCRDS